MAHNDKHEAEGQTGSPELTPTARGQGLHGSMDKCEVYKKYAWITRSAQKSVKSTLRIQKLVE